MSTDSEITDEIEKRMDDLQEGGSLQEIADIVLDVMRNFEIPCENRYFFLYEALATYVIRCSCLKMIPRIKKEG